MIAAASQGGTFKPALNPSTGTRATEKKHGKLKCRALCVEVNLFWEYNSMCFSFTTIFSINSGADEGMPGNYAVCANTVIDEDLDFPTLHEKCVCLTRVDTLIEGTLGEPISSVSSSFARSWITLYRACRGNNTRAFVIHFPSRLGRADMFRSKHGKLGGEYTQMK